jgi:hypothetical protein
MGFHGTKHCRPRTNQPPLLQREERAGERRLPAAIPVAPPPLAPPPSGGGEPVDLEHGTLTPPGRAPSAGRSGARRCRCPVRR